MPLARVGIVLASVLALALGVRAGMQMEQGLDYFADAGGAIDALVRGDWREFAAGQPLMGSFSLLLRAPFVATVFHSSESIVYFAGVIPCLAATVALGLFLSRTVADRGASPAVQGLVAGLAILNPVTFRALHWGHPEELLAAALCVAAVLASLRGRGLIAGVALGLALATKQWAVLAVLPVLLAAPGGRVLTLGVAAGVAGAFTIPLLLADSGSYAQVAESAAGGGSWAESTTPWNVWWPLASVGDLGAAGERYLAPAWVARVSHPLIVLAAVPLSLLLWRRSDRRRDDALLLLALLFLLRCVLDNWNNDYYHAPFVVSLLAWETVRRGGIPYLTLGATLAIGVSFFPDQDRVFADSVEAAPLLCALYLAWALPLAGALALELYAPRRAAAVRAAIARPRVGIRGAAQDTAAVRDRPRPGRDRELGVARRRRGQRAPSRG